MIPRMTLPAVDGEMGVRVMLRIDRRISNRMNRSLIRHGLGFAGCSYVSGWRNLRFLVGGRKILVAR